MNWLIKAVFPTPAAPSIPTVYDITSFGDEEDFTSGPLSASANEFDLERLLRNESPLLITPAQKNAYFLHVSYDL